MLTAMAGATENLEIRAPVVPWVTIPMMAKAFALARPASFAWAKFRNDPLGAQALCCVRCGVTLPA